MVTDQSRLSQTSGPSVKLPSHHPLYVFLSVLLVIGVDITAPTHAQETLPIKLANGPSNELTAKFNEVAIIWGCFEKFTGRPVNCTITQKIRGMRFQLSLCDPSDPEKVDTCNDGGHTHDGSRPLGQLINAIDIDPDPLRVETQQALNPNPFFGVTVVHKLPQAAGVIDVEGEMKLPQGWRCLDHCFNETSWRAEGFVNVLTRNIRQLRDPDPLPPNGTLPPASALYVKARRGPNGQVGTDPDHQDRVAFGGIPFTLQTLPKIAEFYFFSAGRRLSVNDMSLPRGGVFDDRENWLNPHKEHRDGTDADINQFDPDRPGTPALQCKPDHALRLAVDQFLRPIDRGLSPINKNRLTALLCESGGRRHIDFAPFDF